MFEISLLLATSYLLYLSFLLIFWLFPTSTYPFPPYQTVCTRGKQKIFGRDCVILHKIADKRIQSKIFFAKVFITILSELKLTELSRKKWESDIRSILTFQLKAPTPFLARGGFAGIPEQEKNRFCIALEEWVLPIPVIRESAADHELLHIIQQTCSNRLVQEAQASLLGKILLTLRCEPIPIIFGSTLLNLIIIGPLVSAILIIRESIPIP